MIRAGPAPRSFQAAGPNLRRTITHRRLDETALSRRCSIERRSSPASLASHCDERVLPHLSRLRPEQAECTARDKVALNGEGVVDGGVHAGKALGQSGRLEALHLALVSSHGLV